MRKWRGERRFFAVKLTGGHRSVAAATPVGEYSVAYAARVKFPSPLAVAKLHNVCNCVFASLLNIINKEDVFCSAYSVRPDLIMCDFVTVAALCVGCFAQLRLSCVWRWRIRSPLLGRKPQGCHRFCCVACLAGATSPRIRSLDWETPMACLSKTQVGVCCVSVSRPAIGNCRKRMGKGNSRHGVLVRGGDWSHPLPVGWWPTRILWPLSDPGWPPCWLGCSRSLCRSRCTRRTTRRCSTWVWTWAARIARRATCRAIRLLCQ